MSLWNEKLDGMCMSDKGVSILLKYDLNYNEARALPDQYKQREPLVENGISYDEYIYSEDSFTIADVEAIRVHQSPKLGSKAWECPLLGG